MIVLFRIILKYTFYWHYFFQAVESIMDYSGGNPGEAPPGYVEHGNASNVPYGQSTLLHGNENTSQPNKPSVPPPGPAPYPPNQPGYVPYGAPAYGYPMNPGYPPPRYAEAAPVPQQQQQSVVVVTGHERRHPVLIGHVQSYAGHIIMACFVTFCCCFIFGIIAFILASEFITACFHCNHHHHHHQHQLLAQTKQ